MTKNKNRSGKKEQRFNLKKIKERKAGDSY